MPVIQETTPSVTASDGSLAVLDCLATGNPPPVVTWFFNLAIQLPTQGDSRVQQAANNSLIFSPVRAEDEGSYTCRATNTAGTESATLQLIVHGELGSSSGGWLSDIAEGRESLRNLRSCARKIKATPTFAYFLCSGISRGSSSTPLCY